jgi:hypothetical protein
MGTAPEDPASCQLMSRVALLAIVWVEFAFVCGT